MANQFKEADNTFQRILREARGDVLSATARQSLLEDLQRIDVSFEEVDSGLLSYLETKRQYFPRLYFFGNDEVVALLALHNKPSHMSPFASRCFDAVR